MDPVVRGAIRHVVETCHIKRDDIELDLSVREQCPGEFYLLPLMEFRTEDIRTYLEETP